MTFVTIGLAIAGAASVIVPILIHLLSRQRRRPVRWGAMRFLIEALRKHRRRLQLEQLLLLAVRCLILLVLGAALARPILDAAGIFETGGSRAVFIVIDNGLASGVRLDSAGEVARTALDRSVEQAIDLIKSLGPGDVVGVVTAARPANGMVIPPSSDHAAIIDLLRSIEPADAPTDLAAALPLLRSALDELEPQRESPVVYLLSDFRRGSVPLDRSLPSVPVDVGSATMLLAAPAAQTIAPNVQVASIKPMRGLILSPGYEGSGQVTVRLSRSGGELGRDVTQVRLIGEGLPLIDPKVVHWEPGQSLARVDFVMDLAAGVDGALALTAEIDHDTLIADNRRHIVLPARRQIRVLLIDRRGFGSEPNLDRLGAGQWIRRALQPSDQSPMDVVEIDPVALESVDVRGVDAAVLPRPDLISDRGWPILRSFVDGGGLLIVMPPAESIVHQWTDRFVGSMSLPWRIMLEVVEHESGLGLAEEQPASELLRLLWGDLKELLRPVLAYRVLPVDDAQTQAQHVLRFADGSPMVIVSGPPAQVPQDSPSGPDASASHGMVVYLAVAPVFGSSPQQGWTTLPTKPLMVPLFHELIRQGVGLIRTSQQYSAGERPGLGLTMSAAVLVGPHGKTISIDPAGRPSQPLDRSGLYGIFDHAMQRIGTVAVNVEPASGRTDPQNQAAVLEWLGKSGSWKTFDPGDPAAALRTVETGSPLAGFLLLVVLALVVIETGLARWFSHALPAGRSALGGFAQGLRPSAADAPSAAGGHVR